MTLPMTLENRGRLPWHRRPLPWLAVLVGRTLAKASPRTITRVLRVLRRSAAPASHGQAMRARREVVAVSELCAGQYCLERSLSAVVLLRLRGRWATWCTGVHTRPFAAHAWLEVDDQPVGESAALGRFRTLISVPLSEQIQTTEV